MRMVACALFLLVLSATQILTASIDHYHDYDYDEFDVFDEDNRVTTDAIMELSEQYDMDGLHSLLSDTFRRSERNPNDNVVNTLTFNDELNGRGKLKTTRHKLQLDLEQAEYLGEHLHNKAMARFFRNVVAPIYQKVTPTQVDEFGMYKFTKQDRENDIEHVYNKALHVTDFDELLDDDGDPLNLLSDSFYDKQQDIQQQYFQGPNVVVVDDLLTPRALRRIRQLLLESTVWYEAKSPVDTGRYVGAYLNDGLYDRILLALAFELHAALPKIMAGNPLAFLWAYKYDSSYNQGIKHHTDFAAVNVNIWITPDDANLDKQSGGLVVYTTRPPDNVDFDTNSPNTDLSLFEEFLQQTKYANVTVPYRQNRAIIFDSALFHHTDNFQFKEGYTNRRINLTILYGNRPMAIVEREKLENEL